MEIIQIQSIGTSELESIFMRCMATALRNHERVPPPDYDGLTTDQAVDFLGENGYPIAKQTLYGMTYAKTIPYTKRGKRLIFSRNDLKEWLTENRVPTADERFEKLEESINKKARNHG